MKLKIINTREAISTIGRDENFVHFAFRPSLKDIFELMNKVPNLCFVQLAESYNKTTSRILVDIFEMKKITLIVGNIWGHRTDIDEYFRVPVDEIMELSENKNSVRDIALLARVDESMVKFVLENV